MGGGGGVCCFETRNCRLGTRCSVEGNPEFAGTCEPTDVELSLYRQWFDLNDNGIVSFGELMKAADNLQVNLSVQDCHALFESPTRITTEPSASMKSGPVLRSY